MEERNEFTITKEHVLKYGAILLILIAALFLYILIFSVVPAAASETHGDTEPAAVENESLTNPEELNQQIAQLTEQLAAAQEENIALLEAAETAEAEYTALSEHMDALREEYDSFVKQYGTIYHISVDVRRTTAFPSSEDILRFTSIVSEEFYNSVEEGDALPTMTEYFSLPGNSWGVEWTATVVDRYPLNVRDITDPTA